MKYLLAHTWDVTSHMADGDQFGAHHERRCYQIFNSLEAAKAKQLELEEGSSFYDYELTTLPRDARRLGGLYLDHMCTGLGKSSHSCLVEMIEELEIHCARAVCNAYKQDMLNKIKTLWPAYFDAAAGVQDIEYSNNGSK